MNKYLKILSFLILFVFGFLFLHSELDLFSPEQHTHNTHDFCDIVDNAKTENPDISNIKTYNIDVSINSLSIPVNLSYTIYPLKTYNPDKPETGVDANILYNTFLI
jgi:putative Mn2+ efflux pump MntP